MNVSITKINNNFISTFFTFFSILSSHSLLFKAYKKEAATNHVFTVATITFQQYSSKEKESRK
jgi:hypothetical protein